MASEKTKKSLAAGVHAITYTIPFLFLTRGVLALLFIAGTHFVIDRWRLARYVCWAKNWIGGPKAQRLAWCDCVNTGYDPQKPAWMTVWLLIIADNIFHVLLNGIALKWLN